MIAPNERMNMFPTLGNWLTIKDGDPRGYALFKRHYSFYEYKDNRRRNKRSSLFVGPGEKMVLLSRSHDALFVWRKFKSADNQEGINCSVFRNESNILSSTLILEAEELAWYRWGGKRLYTYVSPNSVRSTNPGYCFKVAGWKTCGVTKVNKLVILEKRPEID